MRKLLGIALTVVGLLVVSSQWAWAQKVNLYDLGHYPGGTWAAAWAINDSGVVVGMGDNASGYTDPIGIPLFGANANQFFDLGTLGGTSTGFVYDGPACYGISSTGMIVGQSLTTEGYFHAFAWTAKSGMVDIGTLADIGYSGHNYSRANAVNKSGSLIVGWSGNDNYGYDILPAVWTRKVVGTSSSPKTIWTIQKLDTTGFRPFPVSYGWWGLGVNDFGQITGTAWDDDTVSEPGVVWEPVPGGGWKITRLPALPDHPNAHPVGINDRGEIAGRLANIDWTTDALPVFWSKSSRGGGSWNFTVLPNLPDRLWAEPYSINDRGDIVGDAYETTNWYRLAARWSAANPNLVELLDFPAGIITSASMVNNNGIVVGFYRESWDTPGPRMAAVWLR